MTCYNNRTDIQKEESTFFKNSIQLLKGFQDTKPSDLSNATLLDYHMKTHMLYAGNIKKRPLNKSFINSIVSLHDKLVKEMLKRKMRHNTPLKKV